jgi:hypothetical protein
VIGVVFEAVLYVYLRRQALRKEWGDVRAGLWLTVARSALLKLRGHERDPRNWRPNFLVFVDDFKRHMSLVRLASWFNHDRGVVTACHLVEGDLRKGPVDTEDQSAALDRALAEAGLVAWTEVNVVPEIESGIVAIAQANGMAGLQSNTVMFGFPKEREDLARLLRVLRGLSRAGKSTIIARLNWVHEPGTEQRIDLWWGGLQNNGDMLLLFAYLLRLNPEWSEARLVVRTIVRDENERASMVESLAKLIPEARIQAETEIILRQDGRTVADLIHDRSADAEVVLLGLKDPEPGTALEYAARLEDLARSLRTTIFVRNAGEFAGNLI